MSDYRRVYVPGGTYFLTLITYRRQPIFADSAKVELLRKAFREFKAKRPFKLVAAVILPDHLHCLWCLPDGDADFSIRWQMVQSAQKRFGNPSSMNIASATRAMSRNIWITSTTTRSNMAWLPHPANGLIVLLLDSWRLADMPATGAARRQI